ncbi:hypothetical protein [Nonomuraea fuscirosea]
MITAYVTAEQTSVAITTPCSWTLIFWWFLATVELTNRLITAREK